MRLLFDAATDELHAQLSAWAHAARPPRFVVRRLLPESNTITVDISKPRPATTNADRFVVAYREDRAPATIITATAGTLTTTEREATFDTTEALQRWMLESA